MTTSQPLFSAPQGPPAASPMPRKPLPLRLLDPLLPLLPAAHRPLLARSSALSPGPHTHQGGVHLWTDLHKGAWAAGQAPSAGPAHSFRWPQSNKTPASPSSWKPGRWAGPPGATADAQRWGGRPAGAPSEEDERVRGPREKQKSGQGRALPAQQVSGASPSLAAPSPPLSPQAPAPATPPPRPPFLFCAGRAGEVVSPPRACLALPCTR